MKFVRPMNGIIGMTELALSFELTYGEYLVMGEIISGFLCLTVINDILDFSEKSKPGNFISIKPPFNLQDAPGREPRGLLP